jgi:hypothetical protein
MENNHLPELALQYQPYGKKDMGRPRRRWREQDRLKANELHSTGLSHKHTTFMMMMMMMRITRTAAIFPIDH